MKTSKFIKNFKYEKGVTFIDGWQIVDESGDCDDFAVSVAIREVGSLRKFLWLLITFRIMFWLVKSPSNTIIPRHTIVWIKGKGYMDSSNRRWRVSPTPHFRIIPLLFPWVIFRMVWGAIVKKLFG